MKKYLALLMGAMMVMAGFTSCDEDVTRGRVLSGDWSGDFGMFYTFEDRYGDIWDVDAIETYLEFIPYSGSSTRGTGYQVDYYDDFKDRGRLIRVPYTEVYHSFEWTIENGIIYLDYCRRQDEDLNTFLLVAEGKSVPGEILEIGNTNSRFYLYKQNDFFNWTPYINDFGYWGHGAGWGYYYSDYYGYYAGTRAETGEQTEQGESFKLLHYGSRYAK